MKTITLVAPSIQYKQPYIEMLKEWKASGEKLVPFVLNLETTNFEAMVNEIQGYTEGKNIPVSFVPHSTYWAVDSDENVVGAVNIRHRLNEFLFERGGHIGYGVRPSERQKGYASEILRISLPKVKALGIRKALVTCDKHNFPSAKTIMKNGGVLDSEFQEENGIVVQRYWILL